jgi:histidine triad (HIT) family protein
MPEPSDTCVFCRLVAGTLPISIIDETDDILAVMDIQPVNPGHALVIPKTHKHMRRISPI